MHTRDLTVSLTTLFAELVDGAPSGGGAFVLNSGDVASCVRSTRCPPSDASRSTSGGATIAAHAQHVRYGLSLMNRWAREGGNPFADAKWDEAWKTSVVSEREWSEIRAGLRDESHQWLQALGSPRDVATVELSGMIASIAHLAYHLGAMRQIASSARGPTEGTFV